MGQGHAFAALASMFHGTAAQLLREQPPISRLEIQSHNCVIVLRWFSHVCAKDVHSEEAKLRSALARALSSLHITFSGSPEILTEQQTAAVSRGGEVALSSWSRLGTLAATRESALWTMIPKVHMLQHLVEFTVLTRRNPKGYWTFCEESQMHVHKLVGIKGHKSNVPKRLLEAGVVRFAQDLEKQ